MITISVTGAIYTILILAIATLWYLFYKEKQLVKNLISGHKEILNKSIKEYEDKIKNVSLIKEEELIESEQLVKDRIVEIEKVYKEVIDEQNESLELYEKYIRNFDATIALSGKKLEELDEKGSFKSDDEIGFFFRAVQSLQSILDNFKINKEVLDKKYTDNDEQDKKKD